MTPYLRGIKDYEEGLEPQYHYPVFSEEEQEYLEGYYSRKAQDDETNN